MIVDRHKTNTALGVQKRLDVEFELIPGWSDIERDERSPGGLGTQRRKQRDSKPEMGPSRQKSSDPGSGFGKL